MRQPVAVHVDEPQGPRWELALELIEQGGEGVVAENVLIQRYVGWPGADGNIHVSVFTAWDPKFLPEKTARAEVERGIRAVQHLREADARFASALDHHGVVWDYRYDYGMGAIAIADLDDEGRISWRPEVAR